MKPKPDADEKRRVSDAESAKAKKLTTGTAREADLKKARDREEDAHAKDWRDSHLRAPD